MRSIRLGSIETDRAVQLKEVSEKVKTEKSNTDEIDTSKNTSVNKAIKGKLITELSVSYVWYVNSRFYFNKFCLNYDKYFLINIKYNTIDYKNNIECFLA